MTKSTITKSFAFGLEIDIFVKIDTDLHCASGERIMNLSTQQRSQNADRNFVWVPTLAQTDNPERIRGTPMAPFVC